MNLYTMSEEYVRAFEKLTGSDFDDESIENTLEGLQDEIKIKIANVAAYIKNLEVQQQAILDAIYNMEARVNKVTTKKARLELYLINCMKRCDIKKVEATEFDVKIKNNPPSVLFDANFIASDEYIICKHITDIDKRKIKEDLLNNKLIKGATLVQNQRVEIK